MYRRPSDLSGIIPVFPLAGALLLPRWSLPLNFFEPRYLNMVDDAMSGSRLVGMIQPSPASRDRAHPDLCTVGCVGRLTSYSETEDGRYLVTLSGICRFRILEEIRAETPYRQVSADYAPFESDLSAPDVTVLPARDALMDALRAYLERNALQADWTQFSKTPMDTLVNALCASCPFSVPEKQALLEAPSLAERAQTLIALLELDVAGDDKGWIQ